MIKIYNDNLDLYKPDLESYTKSLDFANTLPTISNEKNVFHCLWRVPKDFTIKHATVIKSIICAHSDCLDNLEINLWSNVDLSNHPLLNDVSKYVNFKIWDYEQEIKGTILENAKHINKNVISDYMCYLEGDLFRLLILNKYGGFYIDMDVLVLRNMSPLNHLEFLYQWGTSEFINSNIQMNGAIMRLEKNSPLSLEFLELIATTPPITNSTAWGNSMYSKINKNDLLALPGVWFNSEWGFEGADNKPFIKVDNINLFPGAFTWHWHNKWDHPIEQGSKFDILRKMIDEKFLEIS